MIEVANVFLTAEAYARLKAVKNEGESFSDVVLENIHQKIDWDGVVGSCKGIDVKKLKAQVKRDREHKWRNTF